MKGLFDDEIVPVPDSSEIIEHFGKSRGFNTPAKVANEMIREARLWQGKNPDKNVLEVITPDWQEYVRANL